MFAIGKPIELAEFAENTSWLTMAVEMQWQQEFLSRSRVDSRKGQTFWLHRPERKTEKKSVKDKM